MALAPNGSAQSLREDMETRLSAAQEQQGLRGQGADFPRSLGSHHSRAVHVARLQ
jgi:hypothetical protein